MLATVLLALTAGAQEQAWVDDYEPHGDGDLPYRLLRPLNFDGAKTYPVIVSLHGGGGRGTDNRKQLRTWNQQLADKQRRAQHPSYVLAPQSTKLWDADHLKTIKQIIAKLPSVDMNRIYLLGHSMGGHGSNILMQIDPDYFAAAAPSAGSGLPETEPFIDASILKDIPIWAFHGDADKVCPYERQQQLFAEMQKLGANMKLTTFAGDGHGIAGKFITGADNGTTRCAGTRCSDEADLLTWLFSQSLAGRN